MLKEKEKTQQERRARKGLHVTVSESVWIFIERNRGATRTMFVEDLLRAGIAVYKSKKGERRDATRLL